MGKLQPGVNDLETWCKKNGREELLQEWDCEKNEGLTPKNVCYGSGKKVWWKCQKGHGWIAAPGKRSLSNTGCPYCSNQKILIGYNDLATTNPELAKQWHPTKNSDLKPTMVVGGSEKKVWWLGKCGHEWRATINHRVNGGNCPYCSGKAVLKGYNDLATTNPELAKQWHPTKNGSFTPNDVTAGSEKKVWWICSKSHEWQAAINDRTNGHNCPICSGKKVLVGYNDLATINPQIAVEWHPTKNGNLKPTMVTTGSGKKVWWLGKCGHEWPATICDRAAGTGCPVCAQEAKTSFPEQVIYYYIKRVFPDAINSDTSVIGKELDIYIPSIKTAIEYDGVYWHKTNKFEQQKNKLCKENGVKLIRVREKGLPLYDDCICIERDNYNSDDSLNQVLYTIFKILNNKTNVDIDVNEDGTKILELYIKNKKSNSLAMKFPDIAKEWHPTKNGALTPNMVSFASQKRVWWKCPLGHEWQASINNRIKGRGCPYCGNKKVLKGFNDLTTINPKIAAEWNYNKNGTLMPEDVVAGSSIRVWWICSECGNEWEAIISDRTRGNGCPACGIEKAGKTQRLQAAQINNFAEKYPEIASEWDYEKNEEPPANYACGSGHKVWWKCKNGHEWRATIDNRVKGRNCPYCSRQKHQKIQCIEVNEIFNSFAGAAKFCSLSNGQHISDCCHGKRKTAGGYHWKFYEEKGEEKNGKNK